MLKRIVSWFRRQKCFLQRPSFMKTEKYKCSSIPGFNLCDDCKYKDPDGLK